MTADTPRVRLSVLGIVAVSLFCALFARLWYLQVMAAPDYAEAAASNQQRTVVEPAPRGRILDRNGIVLVDNRISTVLTVNSQIFDELDEDDQLRVVTRVAEELTRYGRPITPSEVRAEVASGRYGLTPVPIAEDMPEELAVYVSERRQEFTDAVERRAAGGTATTRTADWPPTSSATSVALNEMEYEARQTARSQYQLDDEIGKAGVEATYEQYLRGTPGRRVLEVDANGNVVRQLSFTPPVPGRDIVLTIDANVQALAEAALADQLGLVARPGGQPHHPAQPVARRLGRRARPAQRPARWPWPRTPTTTRPTFTDGISTAEWTALNDPANHYPLINRAIEGQYAPGSTFKLVTAYAAMRSGAIDETTTIADRGSFTLDGCSGRCTFFNAGQAAHGLVDIREALTVSSDVFFYTLGARFWTDHGTFGDPIQVGGARLRHGRGHRGRPDQRAQRPGAHARAAGPAPRGEPGGLPRGAVAGR